MSRRGHAHSLLETPTSNQHTFLEIADAACAQRRAVFRAVFFADAFFAVVFFAVAFVAARFAGAFVVVARFLAFTAVPVRDWRA